MKVRLLNGSLFGDQEREGSLRDWNLAEKRFLENEFQERSREVRE